MPRLTPQGIEEKLHLLMQFFGARKANIRCWNKIFLGKREGKRA
jgi:hypothetical protein